MTENLWEQERKSLLYSKIKEYQQEGYATREAKRIAKRETDDIMADKETFVENFVQDTWGEIDE